MIEKLLAVLIIILTYQQCGTIINDVWKFVKKILLYVFIKIPKYLHDFIFDYRFCIKFNSLDTFEVSDMFIRDDFTEKDLTKHRSKMLLYFIKHGYVEYKEFTWKRNGIKISKLSERYFLFKAKFDMQDLIKRFNQPTH